MHNLVGLDNGKLLLLGGYSVSEKSSVDHIWQLDGEWTQLDNLRRVFKMKLDAFF